jgi:hypothetical protein
MESPARKLRTTNDALRTTRGVTLIDTVVGAALLIIVFAGTAAALELSLDVIMNNKARAGAIALADERIEYIRSLPYALIGTLGGVPSGTIAQNETVTLNSIAYNRRTYIDYEDDPVDGLGGSDTDGTLDYKGVKVDVSWQSRTGARHSIIETRISTPVDSTGREINPCSSPCGTLAVNVVNAAAQPVLNAQVSVVNAGASPAVNLTTYTDASGTAAVIGAPAASGYQVTVTKTGYSTAQTYSVSGSNTNPTPPNLTVTSNNTTQQTFAIDLLGMKTIRTFKPITPTTWTDAFADTSKIATSSNIAVGGGAATIAGSAPYPTGALQSIAIQPSTLATWNTFSATASTPAGTSITYQFYDASGTTLIPDAQIPGNAAGITTSSVDLSHVSTSTYPGLTIGATLSPGASAAPSIDSYAVSYGYGPTPLPSIPFTLQGTKIIGSGPPVVYKYSASLTSGASSAITLQNFEWDTYTLLVPAGSGYDISSACHPVAEQLASQAATTQFAFQPGAQTTSNLYLVPHTTNALLVEARSSTTGDIPYATVELSAGAYDTVLAADACGQAFFSGLASGTYTYAVGATGYATSTGSVTVSGTSRITVSLN